MPEEPLYIVGTAIVAEYVDPESLLDFMTMISYFA